MVWFNQRNACARLIMLKFHQTMSNFHKFQIDLSFLIYLNVQTDYAFEYPSN